MTRSFDSDDQLVLFDTTSDKQRAEKLILLAQSVLKEAANISPELSLDDHSTLTRLTQWVANHGIILTTEGE